VDEMIGYCGSPCHTCAIFLATKETNEKKKHEMKAEIAQDIKKLYGKECKANDIGDCDGCRAKNGRILNKDCPIRKCALKKGVESCENCAEYPCEHIVRADVTGELEKALAKNPEAMKRLDKIRSKLSNAKEE